jgi:hypothetical protein
VLSVFRGLWRWLCAVSDRYAAFGGTGARLALCGFFIVSGWLVLSRLDTLLKSMHPPGGGHYGVGDLAPVFGSSVPAHEVTQTWDLWLRQARAPTQIGGQVLVPHVPTGPDLVLALYLAADALFALAYTAFFAGVLYWIRRRTRDDEVTYRRLFSIALASTPVLLIVDWAENLSQGLLFVTGGASWLEWLTRFLTGGKYLLLLLVAIPLAAGLIQVAWRTEHRKTLLTVDNHPKWLRALAVCRVQVALAAVFGLLLFGPGPLEDQSLDVERRLGDDLGLLLLPLAIVVAAGLVLGGSAWILLRVDARRRLRARQGQRVDPWLPLLLVSGVAAIAILLLVLLAKFGVWHAPIGIYVALAICGLIGLLSLPMRDAPLLEEGGGSLSTSIVPGLLAAAPIGIFGASLLYATIGDFVYLHSLRAMGLSLMGAGFLLGSLVVVWQFSWLRGALRLPAVRYSLIGVATALGGALTGLALASPWDAARVTNGAIGIFGGFLAVAALIGTGLVVLSERVQPPGAFRILRFRQLPVLTLVVIWFLATSLVDKDGTHQIRQQTDAGKPSLVTVRQAFDRWLSSEPPTVGIGASAIRPLVFVASEGGGIRAAYWTAEVLDCLIYGSAPCGSLQGQQVSLGSIFAASGISGGALGLVEVVAESTSRENETGDWIEQRLGDDFVAPIFARMLFGDLPNAFLRLRSVSDRAAVLEGSWERSWPGQERGAMSKEFFARGADQFPLLLLNGTSVTDGCRFETSVLRTALPPAIYKQEGKSVQLGEACRSIELFDRGPTPQNPYTTPQDRGDWVLAATKDAGDYLCGDIHLSTAALLAARFPYVMPAGRVQCGSNASFVVDGGYFEDSGLSPIVEMWTALEPLVADENRRNKDGPCIVPLLVHIDNHYADASAPAPNARPPESLVPLLGLLSTRDGRDQNARVEAMLQFSKRISPDRIALGPKVNGKRSLADRVANLYPRAHPGTEPPLGWTMSRVSRNDLVDQLTNGGVTEELEKARNWFAPGSIACGKA